MEFFEKGFKRPKEPSGYLKFEDGENRFRILSKPISGWIEWVEKKPVRTKEHPKTSSNPESKPRFFLTFIVWDRKAQMVRILELTQATIIDSLQSFNDDEDWGAPYTYDIKVNRLEKDSRTSYTVATAPKKALEDEIVKAFEAKPICLTRLFEGEDPFTIEKGDKITQAFWMDANFDVALVPTKSISAKEAHVLESLLAGNEKGKRKLLDMFGKKQGAKTALQALSEIEDKYFDAAMNFVSKLSGGVDEQAS